MSRVWFLTYAIAWFHLVLDSTYVSVWLTYLGSEFCDFLGDLVRYWPEIPTDIVLWLCPTLVRTGIVPQPLTMCEIFAIYFCRWHKGIFKRIPEVNTP